MIKVLHVTDSITKDSGGVGEVVHLIHKNLAESNLIDSLVVCRNDPKSKSWMDLLLTNNKYEFTKNNRDLISVFNNFKPNLIHIHGLWNKSTLQCLKFAKKQKTKIVLSSYGMAHPWALKTSKMKKYIYKMLIYNKYKRYFNGLISETDVDRFNIQRFFKTNENIYVVQNPVEKKNGIQNDLTKRNRYIFIGRIVEQKGLIKLTKLWSSAYTENLIKNKLDIYGTGNGKYFADFCNLVHHSPGVEFHRAIYGHKKEQVFREAKALVLYSESEGLPMIAIEAMSYGLPVICRDHCGLDYEIEKGLAYLIENGEDQKKELCDTVNKVNSFGHLELNTLLDHVDNFYNSDKVIKKLIKTYEMIFQNSSN